MSILGCVMVDETVDIPRDCGIEVVILLVTLTLRPCKNGMLPKTTVSNAGPPVRLMSASFTSRSTVLCKEERLVSTARWITSNI